MMDCTMDRDWTALPQDILLMAMGAMDVPDIVCSGAVCSAWHTAYALFRRLRLPTSKQPPCLLYACEDYGADAAALYSPSSSTTYRVPIPGGVLPRHSIYGSAHGWLFLADEAANPYLLNPLTGARAALPPFSTLRRVTSSFSDADGSATYAIDYGWHGKSDVRCVKTWKAICVLCDHVAISSVGEGGACVVLLVSTFYGELSFARTGDEHWTSLSSGLDVEPRTVCFPDRRVVAAAHNDSDGLFYVIGNARGVYALDLSDVQCPVSRPLTLEMEDTPDPYGTHYLVFARSGDLLLVSRRCAGVQSPVADIICSDGRRRKGPAMCHSFVTVEMGVYKVDVEKKRLVQLTTGVGDNAIFLGHNSPLCLPIDEYPVLTPNCAYLTTDNDDILHRPVMREDIGIWKLESNSMQKLDHVWPLRPWLHTSAPVWITPSLY